MQYQQITEEAFIHDGLNEDDSEVYGAMEMMSDNVQNDVSNS